MMGCSMKNIFSKYVLLIIILLSFSITSYSQGIKLKKRVMTDIEFTKLKNSVGTYEKGKNYNQIIDGHGTGLVPPTKEQWEEMKNQQLIVDKIEFPNGTAAVPSNYDNSATNWFPPIGNQGIQNSCVSWACGYYTKTFQEAKEHNWDLSGCSWEGGSWGHPDAAYQDKIFSPAFIYNQVNNGFDNGSYYSDNIKLLDRIGCCTWDKMQYIPNDYTIWPAESAWRQAPLYRSQPNYSYINVSTDADIENLKQLLTDGNLAIIAVNANYFYSHLATGDIWTLDNYNPSGTNHANTIVGYDDNYGPFTESGNSNTRGAFKIANSWGVGGWENNADGFYYISYECMKQRIRYIYLYQNYVNYKPEMVAVFKMNHSKRGENSIDLGIGDTGSPAALKSFDDFYYNGGNYPFPDNKIVVDITEFLPYLTGSTNQFFMRVYDGGTSFTGTIQYFSVEMYDDYINGIRTHVYTSTETPLSTQQNNNVYANIIVSTDCALNLQPGNYELSNLNEGNQYYIDRPTYILVTVPDEYKGYNMIKTANDDKTNTNLDFHFNLCSSTDVYIAYDHRISTPSWITSNYDNKGERIYVTDANLKYFNIWKRKQPAQPGVITFGDNEGDDESSMYFVFYKPSETFEVNIKVFLQGSYAGGDSMHTTLWQSKLIPKSQPYNALPWNYSGTENVLSIPSGVVDWVLAELRTGPPSFTIAAARAAFLKSDGTIVDLDGISHVSFSGITPGSYYIVVKHRNHLAVMSADLVELKGLTTYNFTTGSGQFYGGTAGAKQIDTSPIIWGMVAGNADNTDQNCFASDLAKIKTNILSGSYGYLGSDIDLDGHVFASDYAKCKSNVLLGYGSSVPNP